ncbi:spore coat protein [Paenactinomyces guangxiensis]|uniref:Spore coat protein n=1 Tax=Paenactinomyces guangxiensis TaxID=1490290 RepID=A0A7W2A939_9BACL|nr:spore coat protein [Paenactinomyces guangxiensis]MBA4494792.1 spore coat protein [Paenactinomyces guangxiensis]MBH8591875.1 spore coat protein [Paenactinomyces guangxiensis]
MNYEGRLAWHETLELHELVAFQSSSLIQLKRTIRSIEDPELRSIYRQSIRTLEKNISELLRFYPSAPSVSHSDSYEEQENIRFAGTLLGMTKSLIRNYALAITETATPALRDTFTRQLNRSIPLHAQAFNYLYRKGAYPAYNLEELLANDRRSAAQALRIRYD